MLPLTFTGFADDTFKFWKTLDKHQDRAWFQAHKAEYVEGWEKPMAALLVDVRARVDDAFEYCELEEPKVFRIHRDTRFSKDKTPYKTHVAGLIMARAQGGSSATEVPVALYLSVGLGDANRTGHGHYGMSPDQLARFRAAVLDDARGAEVAKLTARLEKSGFSLAAADSLKRVPKGIDPGHPRADLLRRKGLIAMGPSVPRELLTSKDLVTHLVKQTRKAVDLVTWLVHTTGG